MLASLAATPEQQLGAPPGQFAPDARDLNELFRALHGEAARVMDATVFLFALYDDTSQTVQVVRQMDRGVEHPGGSFPLGKGFTSEVIRTRTPRLVRLGSAQGPVRLLYGTEAEQLVAPQSCAVVPILSGERVLGVLSAQSYRPEAYQDADLARLGAIAAQAATAIKRVSTTRQMALEHERRALQLEAVLATMTDAMLIVDARGAIVRLNRAARELLRLDSASLVLGQPLDLQRLEQWPSTAREIAAALVPFIDALRSGKSVGEQEVELHSGQLRVLGVSASVLRPAEGAEQGGVILCRDVTRQRDLERLREDIFSMAWHDMKTPIAVIRGHGELLLRRLAGAGNPDRETLEAEAALIVAQTDRLAELLTTLFDVSSLEAGLLSIVRAPADLAAIAREVAEGMRPAARRQIEVLAEGSVPGEWDERRIRQVLMNLLSNALKYSPEGSRVTVSVTADERGTTVAVRDEGIGLHGSELAQLFRRGYRAEPARSVIGGGLGLYFSHGIVAAHGGRMWAESLGRGRGSAFCFTLPFAQRQARA